MDNILFLGKSFFSEEGVLGEIYYLEYNVFTVDLVFTYTGKNQKIKFVSVKR